MEGCRGGDQALSKVHPLVSLDTRTDLSIFPPLRMCWVGHAVGAIRCWDITEGALTLNWVSSPGSLGTTGMANQPSMFADI